jgi:hypothetical protein
MCSKSKHKIIVPHNGEIVAGSLQIRESRKIARLLLKNADSETWHQAIVVENIPNKPSSRLQKYRLTPKGKALINAQRSDDTGGGPI